LPPVRFFDDIDDSFCTATLQEHWTVHYSRAVENQLDVMHLPFVHHNTIGRGGNTVVDGPVVEWIDDDKLRFHVFNRRDDGTPAKTAEELDKAAAAVHLDFLFPNLWQNHLSAKMRITAAFVPVDEQSCVVYVRFHQKLIRLPWLRTLFNWVMMHVNRIILAQDRRIVWTQQPVKTSLHMGELLVQGDRPIVEYRRRRQELLDASQRDE
jgi:phenylpropionate dioxygenase-like ring-hydroxylating dioxygenase large terminal subunit